MTVSRVYKSPVAVSASTRERVLSTGERLGFVPNMLAGNLASGRNAMIGVVVPSLRNSNNASSIQGMADCLRDASYQFMITNTGYSLDDETAAVEAFIRRRTDGLVLTGTRHSDETCALLRSSGIPVVELWETEGPSSTWRRASITTTLAARSQTISSPGGTTGSAISITRFRGCAATRRGARAP